MSIIYSTKQDRYIDTDHEECTCQYDQASRFIDESGLAHSKNCAMSDEQLCADVLDELNNS